MANDWKTISKASLIFPPLACILLTSACDLLSRQPDQKMPEKPGTALFAEKLRRGPEPPASPTEISFEQKEFDDSNNIEGLRWRALREAAHGVGSQHGYVRRAWEIQGILERSGKDLSRTYDFRHVAKPAPSGTGYVIPPSVSSSVNLNRTEPTGIAFAADEQFEIVEKGRLSPTVPTWRDFLLFYPGAPVTLPESLEPVGDDEEIQFRKWLELGWYAGIEQANAELETRLSKLRRTYEGMLLYRKLAKLGKINRPVIESTFLDNSANFEILRTGERTAQIVAEAAFRSVKDERPRSGHTFEPEASWKSNSLK